MSEQNDARPITMRVKLLTPLSQPHGDKRLIVPRGMCRTVHGSRATPTLGVTDIGEELEVVWDNVLIQGDDGSQSRVGEDFRLRCSVHNVKFVQMWPDNYPDARGRQYLRMYPKPVVE